jgi:4-amino-4-deoxy-L-arabinose transferase-like glycosyltransferase
MLASGDFVDIRFQDEPRYLQPAGIYWLQSAAVAVLGGPDAREIGAFRAPSLIGAVLAVLLTGWLGAVLFGRNAGIAAAALLACCVALGVEARIAKTDAALLASITAAQIAMLRIYLAPDGRWWRPAVFWSALGVGMMLKGPIILVFCGATVLALIVWDRQVRWLRGFRVLWGLPLMLAIVLPWYVAIGIESDWQFYVRSVGRNLLGKVGESQQSHDGPPGYYLGAFTLMFWPGSLFAAFALLFAWRRRAEPSVRFLIAWIVPSWVIFELVATKLPHYVLPTYPAIACLAGAALMAPPIEARRWIRILAWVYALVWLAAGALVSALAPAALWRIEGEAAPLSIAVGAAAFSLAVATLQLKARGRAVAALASACTAGVLVSLNTFAAVMPRLDSFWLSPRIVEAAERAGLCPQTELVSSAYREPSLIFLNGPEHTQLADTPEATADLLGARPECMLALVEAQEAPAFLERSSALGLQVRAVGSVAGVNYSEGDELSLALYAATPRGEAE